LGFCEKRGRIHCRGARERGRIHCRGATEKGIIRKGIHLKRGRIHFRGAMERGNIHRRGIHPADFQAPWASTTISWHYPFN
jgi:hypothetical protein